MEIIQSFDQNFLKIHSDSKKIIGSIPEEKLFIKPFGLEKSIAFRSGGELILRSAGAVEQCFGGITAKLWDDPFEWTLPEEISTRQKILDYLDEVERTRLKGFSFFESDRDLYKSIPAPENLKTLFEILLETIIKAGILQGRAFSVFQIITGQKHPEKF